MHLLFCSNSKTKTATPSKPILCHFYVVIAKNDFNFRPEKDAVTVRFGEAKLGSWPCTDHRMSVEK